MKFSSTLFGACAFFFTSCVYSAPLTDISDFAKGICDEIAQTGDVTRTKIEGKVNGELSGVAKLLGGSLDAGGLVVVDSQKYEGLPLENLSDQMDDARSCRKELAKLLLDERRRLENQVNASGANHVEACVVGKIRNYEESKSTSVSGGASASSPGIKGGTNTAHQDLCHRVGSDQLIISATTANTCCHGGRCSVTAPLFTEVNRMVCVTTKAWSESKSSGGGGCAKYNLNIAYKDLVTDELKAGFEIECL